MKSKKLPEIEALKIFYEIILVVESLHKVRQNRRANIIFLTLHPLSQTEKHYSS